MDVYIKGEKKKKIKSDWLLLVLSLIILSASIVFFLYTQYPSIFQFSYNIEKSYQVSPDESIIINFSKPIISNYFGWKVSVSPKTNFNYHLENRNRRLVISPEEYWLPENNYEISISGKNYFLSAIDNVFNFKTISYPKLVEFYPPQDAKDVLLDIEDPMRATFDKSTNEFDIKFVANPFKELNHIIDDDHNQIKLMPKEDLERGEKYSINIYAKYKEESDAKYQKIGNASFETKTIDPIQVWEKDFTARLEQAKKFTQCRIKEGKYIDINLKSQIMTIFENGKLLDVYIVSSGKKGMDTEEGSFAIANKTSRAWSKEYGLFMPYWQALVPSGKFGIHELPEWPGGYKEGQNHLGTPVSHGCVRLGVGPAERVYNFTDIGTPVVIHY